MGSESKRTESRYAMHHCKYWESTYRFIDVSTLPHAGRS